MRAPANLVYSLISCGFSLLFLILIRVSSFHFLSHSSVVSIHSIIARYCTSCFIYSSCHCVSPSYKSCFIVILLHLLLVYYIICIIWVQFFQYHTTLILSHISINVLVCLILATFSYRFLFYSQEIFSLILDLFLASLPSTSVLSASGLSIILSIIPLLLT